MRLVTVSGPPSCGKTAVILKTAGELRRRETPVAVVKFDCLKTDDDERYAAAGIPVRKGLSGPLCPDHYFASNIEEAFDWGRSEGVSVLFSESAGLCNRCSPHLHEVLALCVIDNLSGIQTPAKIGPMLKAADVVVVTKGDIVSQAEREVFASRVRSVNPGAIILHVNGLTGQGAYELSRIVWEESSVLERLGGTKLRFPMPGALCSYCLGEQRIGTDYQVGNVRKMKIDKIKTEGATG